MNPPTPSPGRSGRRRVLGVAGMGLLRVVLPALGGTVALRAHANGAELRTFEISRDEDGVHLWYQIELDLGRSVEDALAKSVPLFFVAEAEIFRERWYWRDRRVANAQRTWRVVYQPLTSNWRTSSTGGLAQNHATSEEALAVVTRAARWRIAEPGQIEEGARHYVEFAWRLDTAQLARPMQIGVSGQPDWQLSVKRSQRL